MSLEASEGSRQQLEKKHRIVGEALDIMHQSDLSIPTIRPADATKIGLQYAMYYSEQIAAEDALATIDGNSQPGIDEIMNQAREAVERTELGEYTELKRFLRYTGQAFTLGANEGNIALHGIGVNLMRIADHIPKTGNPINLSQVEAPDKFIEKRQEVKIIL